MSECRCPCGKVYIIAENLIGSGYACPSCGLFHGDSRGLTESQIEALIYRQQAKARASRIIPKSIHTLTSLTIAVLLLIERQPLSEIIGWGSAQRYILQILWAIALFVVSIISLYFCQVTSVTLYQERTGNLFVGNRAAYGRAGGIDIAFWSPILGFLSLLALYWVTLRQFNNDPISLIRNPWFFLFGFFLTSLGWARLLSIIAYRPDKHTL